MLVPSFILRRLYVKGSLRNNQGGFQLQLKNTLGSGYAREMLPLSVDGQELPLEGSFFLQDDKEVPFTAVSKEAPFTLAMNKTSTLLAKGMKLASGPHKVGIGFVVQGLGKMSFDITDIVAEEKGNP
ncbi:MAG: hypothetical protein HY676_02215 [Chloroflexi bacterium]|nr:hypothetical protein [Chloroflexota bacterium]